jgi:hypothetical protein
MFRAGRLLLAGLAVVAVALVSRVSAADPKYLPSDTEIIFTINFRQIIDSDLAKSQKDLIEQIKKKIQADDKDKKLEQVQKYLEQAGFDPLKDFGSVTFAMPPTIQDRDNYFMLIDGNFDANKIEAAAKAIAADTGDKVAVLKFAKKYVAIEMANPRTEKKSYAIILNSTTLAMCPSEEAMKAAIGRATGTKKSKLKPEVLSLLKTTSDTQSFSFIATGSGLVKLLSEAPNVPEKAIEYVKQIDGISGAITVKKDIKLQVAIATKDANTAKEFAGLLTKVMPLANNFIGNWAAQDEKRQPLADAAKTLKATSMDNNLIIRGELSFDNIQKLLKNVKLDK